MKKASLFKRFLAVFIDGLLFGFLFIVFRNPAFNVLFLVYETILVSRWDGYTIGKKIIGIQVVTTSGGKVDWVKAFIRSISRILSGLPLGLGYLWALWDAKSQTWHDKIADTLVVDAES
jgi:uncharacterized RDD family membrane protein YckC